MPFKKILVPYDESEHARSAVRCALDLAGADADATVYVVTVIPSATLPDPTLLGDGFTAPLAVGSSSSYEHIMEMAVQRASAEAGAVIEDTRQEEQCDVVADAVIAGSPVEGIADYVESHDIDLVVMGRRGLGALRGMLGSVSFGVLRSVDVPVLTVK